MERVQASRHPSDHILKRPLHLKEDHINHHFLKETSLHLFIPNETVVHLIRCPCVWTIQGAHQAEQRCFLSVTVLMQGISDREVKKDHDIQLPISAK